MELERCVFPLLDETLNYLDVGITAKIKNIVRYKNNKFVFHISVDKGCKQINNEEIHFALLKRDIKPFSSVQPGSLLGCLHPQYKKWMRCYIVSIMHNHAKAALCDTGEITITNKLKEIPDEYKLVPVITFEAEVKCICPHGKLQHLMKNSEDYIATFESFINKSNVEIYKKMKLTYKNSSIDFIIKKWDVQSCINTEGTNNNLLFKNGSAVVIAKLENYDRRYIFVKSVDQCVRACKDLQTYCVNALNIQRNPIAGDIVAVKCIDKFYRGKIIDILDHLCYSLYLIDTGYVISASIECIADMSEKLKMIPPTVCLVGLKDIGLKPWTSEASLYISKLFENSTTMILEYNDNDNFGLDSVVLTIVNNYEDVNENLRKFLRLEEDLQSNDTLDCINPVHDLSLNLVSNTIIPVKMENLVKPGPQALLKPIETFDGKLLSGSAVYMTGFVDLTEIYIRKIEDHNDELESLLNIVNKYCQSAKSINRPLIIGEIVGAQSTLDESFYRGKVIKQNDATTYLIQYIDFGDTDNVPLSNIFEIPKDFMTPSNVMAITLKRVKSSPLNPDALNYITNLLSNYEPMIIDCSPIQPLKDVTLTTVNGNENVNEQLNKLLNNIESTSPTKVVDQLAKENSYNYENIYDYGNLPKLKNGDFVFITTFIDVHHVYIRKVEDETDEFSNFIENVNLYCSSEKPIRKLPTLNEIVGAKSKSDGYFYRAKILKKVSDVSYNVQFIDYGIEENVKLSEIVTLSADLKQFIPTAIMVKLKDVPFSILNEEAHKYISFISENETLLISDIEEITNNVILKTEKNENVNDHLICLTSGSNEKRNAINLKQTEENDIELDSQFQSFSWCNGTSLEPGSVVYMTAFVDLNEMYIRKLEHYNDEYDNFLEKVNEFCLSAAPINRPLAIGEIIGAQSTLDDCFYRGKILKKIDERTYSIHYIDFGDKDNVPISNIFEIPKDFMIPSTVIQISLKGIKSSCKLNVKASNYITNLLSTYEPLTIDFDTKLPMDDVTLTIINSNENVTENLNKLLEDVDHTATNNVVENNYVTAKVEPQVSQDVISHKLYNDTTILKNGDIVYITAYIDLCNIFVRKVDDNNDELQKLIERVNTYCSSGSNFVNKPPVLNQIVGAKSSADGYFYRAKITEIIDEKNYEIIFIDFGFEENVNIADVVPLPIELTQVPPSISLIGLKGSTFETLNSEGHSYLESLMFHNEVMKIEFEDLNAVTLTVISKDQNVIEYLNKLHIDVSVTDNTIINNSISSASGMKYISQDISIPQIPSLINKSIVTIHAFVSLKDIYISVPFNVSEVNKFFKDFSVFCLTCSQLFTRSPTIGEMYGIKSSIDHSFNRGIVKEQLNENQYKVFFIDLGIEDIVPSNSFVEIPDRLKEVPRTIYPVGLRGIHFENLNAQAMSYVNLLCDNMPLIIEFDENNPDRLSAVTLTIVKTGQNVNNHLANLLTEKERDSPETVQMLSKGDIVYISMFIDLQSIYVRRINNGTDRFKSFLENFSSCCALENPITTDPKIGEIIAAKEKNGSKFYRAEVISRIDNEHLNVCFIDFGSRDVVHKSNIVRPSEIQQQNYPPTFLVSLDGFNSEPLKPKALQYIEAIIQTETFLIESITEQSKVVLKSVNTQCNINEELRKLMSKEYINAEIKSDLYIKGDIDIDEEKSIVQYYKPPLEVPTQVWVAEKMSATRYTVHTYKSRLEFMQLEKQIFEDSKTFKSVKSVKINMPCIVYFSPSWYRGEILEVIDKVAAKVCLIDVGNFSVIRNVREIFSMPSKYKGKSLLLTIDVVPEPQDTISTMTFKIIAKKHLENTTIVEISEPFADQSYYDLDNVGLPSFSSTPIPEDPERSQFDGCNKQNSCSPTLCNREQQTSPFSMLNSSDNRVSNILTIKDVQHAKWPKGSLKTLTFLCLYQDYLVMRDHLIDDALADLEMKIQEYCGATTEPYSPIENELCLVKYSDGLWYRAVCIKITNDPLNEINYTVYFLDWGMEYSVNNGNIYKMAKEFAYLPATAHKCYVKEFETYELPLKEDVSIGFEVKLIKYLKSAEDKLEGFSLNKKGLEVPIHVLLTTPLELYGQKINTINCVAASEWGTDTLEAVYRYVYTQVNCEIIDKLAADSYTISCDTIITWVNAHLT